MMVNWMEQSHLFKIREVDENLGFCDLVDRGPLHVVMQGCM